MKFSPEQQKIQHTRGIFDCHGLQHSTDANERATESDLFGTGGQKEVKSVTTNTEA